MHIDLQSVLSLLVYGLGPILVLGAAYLAWRRIRLRCRRYGPDPYRERASERKKFWGYE